MGRYHGRPFAITRSHAGDPEMFVVLGDNRIGYVSESVIEGNPVRIVLEYGASNSPGCNI